MRLELSLIITSQVPLKKQPDKRTLKTTAIHYHVNDDTEIKNIKKFLTHINTQAELLKYLSDKLLAYLQEKPKKLLVMHHTTMQANVSLSAWSDITIIPRMESGQHNLEEGDQLVILNAFDVTYVYTKIQLQPLLFSQLTKMFLSS